MYGTVVRAIETVIGIVYIFAEGGAPKATSADRTQDIAQEPWSKQAQGNTDKLRNTDSREELLAQLQKIREVLQKTEQEREALRLVLTRTFPNDPSQEEEEPEEEDFLQQRFDEKNFQQLLAGKKKVLVLGMGGGCDVFMAYTFAKMLGVTETGGILYANCISERKNGIPEDHLTLVTNALCAVPEGEPRPLQKGENTYGTTYLEQSVPRGPGHSPLLIELRGHKGVTTEEQVRELTAENVGRITKAFCYLGVDLVIGIDCGGDSLTGGKDFACSPLTGRDQQVLFAFRKYRAENPDFAFCHVVLAPGCDAETPEKIMRAEVGRSPSVSNSVLKWCAGREFRGCFSIEQLITNCFPFVKELEPNRTPYLMYRALRDDDQFKLDRPQPSEKEYDPCQKQDLVKLSRHGNFELIPRSWLLHGLVFSYDPDSDILSV